MDSAEKKIVNLKVLSPNVEYTDDFIISKYKYTTSDVKMDNNELLVSQLVGVKRKKKVREDLQRKFSTKYVRATSTDKWCTVLLVN